MPAQVVYRTRKGRDVLRIVQYDKLAETLRRLYQARIPADAHDSDEPSEWVGAVETHPDHGRLTWWADVTVGKES